MKYLITLFSSLILLSGCAVNQSIDLNYTPPQQDARNNGISIETTVIDNRSFIKDGKKTPSYLGQYRAILGIPWSVKNHENIPLAEQLASDLQAELATQGYNNTQSNPNLRLNVSINDWNFTSYRNGDFWYNLHVTLTNAQGSTLQSFDVEGKKFLQATGPLGGSKRAFERDMPVIYKEIINSIVKNPAHPLPR